MFGLFSSFNVSFLGQKSLRAFVDNFVYNVSFPCFVPDSYVASDLHRLKIYRQLVCMYNLTDVDRLSVLLKDIYGPLPVSVQNIINVRLQPRSIIVDIIFSPCPLQSDVGYRIQVV